MQVCKALMLSFKSPRAIALVSRGELCFSILEDEKLIDMNLLFVLRLLLKKKKSNSGGASTGYSKYSGGITSRRLAVTF